MKSIKMALDSMKKKRNAIKQARILIAILVVEFLLLLLVIWSPPIIDSKYVDRYKADPYGTGSNMDIRRTSHLHGNGALEYETYEIINADGSSTLVAEFFCDKEGELQKGSWEWENGTYFVWVINDEGVGEWVESEPPLERRPP